MQSVPWLNVFISSVAGAYSIRGRANATVPSASVLTITSSATRPARKRSTPTRSLDVVPAGIVPGSQTRPLGTARVKCTQRSSTRSTGQHRSAATSTLADRLVCRKVKTVTRRFRGLSTFRALQSIVRTVPTAKCTAKLSSSQICTTS